MIPEVMDIRFEKEYLIIGLTNFKFDERQYFGSANLKMSFYPSIRTGRLFMNKLVTISSEGTTIRSLLIVISN